MRIVITGAASGIGRAAASKLASDCLRRGTTPRLVLADITGPELEAVAETVRGLGAEVETLVGDLADPETCYRIIGRAEQAFGGLDALISNAGILEFVSMLDMSLEQYDRAFAINTRPTWLLAKTAHPLLKAAKGCIVATCSVAAYEPTPGLGAYSPSKAALLMLVRQFANAWGPDGIRSNSVSPGTTSTGIGRSLGPRPIPSNAVGRNPLGIVATPEDQAAAIAFLASPEARFINGADLVVDGGARTQLMTASGLAQPLDLVKPS
jgi:NAD(P)-dependent dehydrogenase (short-subunit alcohol dehydrogenase family)